MRRKIFRESLTARIFLWTLGMLVAVGGLVFFAIAWATPTTYTAVATSDLQAQMTRLTAQLAKTNFSESGPLLDEFIRTAGVDLTLLDAQGRPVETPSTLASWVVVEDGQVAVSKSVQPPASAQAHASSEVAMTVNAVSMDVRFADRSDEYVLCAVPYVEAENQVVEAMRRIAPWLAAALCAVSLLVAFCYSRSITRPIVRLSGIAGKMARLDFDWTCGEKRCDEIGVLGRSLDEMAQKLSQALQDLQHANLALQGEVARERALEQEQLDFFAAASHELKTPVTILKGQLSGMLDGVGVYKDHEKYLARALQVTARMEGLIQEILAISRMDRRREKTFAPLDLAALVKVQLAEDAELIAQRGLQLSVAAEAATVQGDASELATAVDNLLSNAVLYSPEGAQLRVWVGRRDGRPGFSIENFGAHIQEEALPRVFDAFYREERSRNRRTGGSGLGLYLVKMILDRHGAGCRLENTADGVKATVIFPALE